MSYNAGASPYRRLSTVTLVELPLVPLATDTGASIDRESDALGKKVAQQSVTRLEHISECAYREAE
jgi:hypothetical protein